MGQRRQIARGAHRAHARHNRVYSGIEEIEDLIHDQRATPRVAGGQHVRPKQEHGTNHVFAEGFAYTTCVRSKQVELELFELVGRNPDLGEPSETRVDSIGDLTRREDVVDDLPGCSHSSAGLVAEIRRRAATRNGFDSLDGQGLSVHQYVRDLTHQSSSERTHCRRSQNRRARRRCLALIVSSERLPGIRSGIA